MSFSPEKIQSKLQAKGLDGWLFYDFWGRDPIAYSVLGLEPSSPKRRWYYYIPAKGTPQKLVHKIEAGKLDSLPGEKQAYASWAALRETLGRILGNARLIAMQYSPENAIPYVSMVDAGTIEMIRSLGVEVASSADLVQTFEACWTGEQLAMHREAGEKIDAIIAASFERIGEHVKAGKKLTEHDQQQWMLEQFKAQGLFTADGPDVALNEHASDPHFEPSPENKREFRQGDWVLHDVWGKLTQPGSVYYDVTWVAFIGAEPSQKHQEIFGLVRDARDAAIEFVQKAIAKQEPVCGYQVDDVARAVIDKAGYGEYFFHRTGHSIGEEIHSTGANMDNLESHDDRRIIPNTCFSIEPGIYLPEFGVRSEVNVFVSEESAEVTGKIQKEIIRIGA